MKIIDSHIHLFNLTQGDYHWLKKDNPPFWPDKHLIANNVNESDLVLIPPLTLEGFVHIEAGYNNQEPWQEIAWLEQSCHLPFRSIANIDITLPAIAFVHQLKRILTHTSVVGFRHILDENAFELLSSKQVQQNFSRLNQEQLIFEVQMPFSDSQAVNALSRVIANNSNIRFIINHAGIPPTKTHDFSVESPWYLGLAAIATFENVAIKCSGWEMFDRHYNTQWSLAIIKQCLALFGSRRVMISSNFPLSLFHCNYHEYWQNMVKLATSLPNELFYNNSKYWYKFT
ncbi:amidohydrolase family protein [Thalassotalea piscium]